jgi:hypothetical protein
VGGVLGSSSATNCSTRRDRPRQNARRGSSVSADGFALLGSAVEVVRDDDVRSVRRGDVRIQGADADVGEQSADRLRGEPDDLPEDDRTDKPPTADRRPPTADRRPETPLVGCGGWRSCRHDQRSEERLNLR